MIYGLAFKGLPSKQFGLIVKSDNRQLLPDVTRLTKQVTGYPGVVDFGIDTYSEKTLTVVFQYNYRHDPPTMAAMAEQIAGWLYDDGSYYDLIFDDAPQRKYKAKCAGRVDLSQGNSLGTMSIAFTCNPPWPFDLNNAPVSPADTATRLNWDTASIDTMPVPLTATLKNSSAAFPTGTSDTNGVPASFVDGSAAQVAFNGKSAGNIVNPQIKSTGKNLFNPAVGTVTSNGVTCTVDPDGTITLNGTASATLFPEISPVLRASSVANTSPVANLKNGQKYTLSIVPVSGTVTGGLPSVAIQDTTHANLIVTSASTSTFTAGQTSPSTSLNIGDMVLGIPSGLVFNNYKFRLQLEQGSAATAWEQYKQSILAITGTIGASDRFTWDGVTGKIDGSAVTTSGGLLVYQNGWIFVLNSDGTPATVVPTSEITYYQGQTSQINGTQYMQDLAAAGAMRFTVGGTMPVKPKIILLGYVPSGLTLTYGAQAWKYSAELPYDGIVIDCAAQTVTRLSDGANLYGNVDSASDAFFTLQPGQNEIDISGVSGAWPNDLTVIVQFTPITI